LLLIAIGAYILFPKLHAVYHKIEEHFMTNYNDREIRKENKRQNTPSLGHMTEFDIAKDLICLGKTL
jgi:CPA2 family monovalent cation:H+ antiporter-2